MFTPSFWPASYFTRSYWPPGAAGPPQILVAATIVVHVRLGVGQGVNTPRLAGPDEWAGLILCNPSNTDVYTAQLAQILALGYEIIDEVPLSGLTRVYVVGPYPESILHSIYMPNYFIRLKPGVPVTPDLVKKWDLMTTGATFSLG